MKKFVCVVFAMLFVMLSATAAVAELPRYNNEFDSYEVITLGRYEQDNDPTNGKEPIEWIVLAKEDGKALVLAKYGLEHKRYNGPASVSWKTCGLRKWLNGEFLESFTEEEKNRIVSHDVYYSWYYPELHTTDKVWLPDQELTEKYLPTPELRKCIPTPYAVANGTHQDPKQRVNGTPTTWWWLARNGWDSYRATHYNGAGVYHLNGCPVERTHGCVRPAMVINLE